MPQTDPRCVHNSHVVPLVRTHHFIRWLKELCCSGSTDPPPSPSLACSLKGLLFQKLLNGAMMGDSVVTMETGCAARCTGEVASDGGATVLTPPGPAQHILVDISCSLPQQSGMIFHRRHWRGRAGTAGLHPRCNTRRNTCGGDTKTQPIKCDGRAVMS